MSGGSDDSLGANCDEFARSARRHRIDSALSPRASEASKSPTTDDYSPDSITLRV